MRRFLRWCGLMLAAALVALPLWALATADGRALVKTAVILPEVLSDAPVGPFAVSAMFTPAPVREEVTFPSDVGAETATLYRPGGTDRYGAVILHLGVNPDPDDATLHRLAAALARSGVVALIPRSSRLMAGDIDQDEIPALVGAFQYLQQQAEVDGERIGFAGFCVGASLSALAAADSRIADQVAFINFFGGWADARDLLAALITGRQQYGDIDEAWVPHEMAREVFLQHLLAGIDDPTERLLLEQAAAGGTGRVLATDVDPAALSPEGRSLYRVLTAGDPAEVRRRLDELPPELHARLLQMSPAHVASRIKARVFIMHDRNDVYVPFVEARRFAAAFGENPPTVTEFSIFQHMHPRSAGDRLTFVLEVGKLFRHLHGVLAEVS